MLILIFVYIAILSTSMYLYLNRKTKISFTYIYKDNIAVIILAYITFIIVYLMFKEDLEVFLTYLISFGLSTVSVAIIGLIFAMIRFWRTPKRKLVAKQNEVISPVDGKVLYIKKIENGEVPISIKKGLKAKLTELTETDIINGPVWLIGVNMTPFDVHKNCTPVAGQVILNKHIKGQNLSLKHPEALLRNERNTLVLKTLDNDLFGIVQTASKLVRRIDSYVNLGDYLKQGEWFGMIRFGSQVDIIIPIVYSLKINEKQQIYAIKTIIAEK